ncbi:MAG: hypothetical protein IJM30_02585 [Thermoguttaceae bacterium]|nr:hypothetical protein [Thermoguttaceae bacterium]
MKKNLMKRFFVEEEGMEAMQVVMIGAIAAVVVAGVYLVGQRLFVDLDGTLTPLEEQGTGGGQQINPHTSTMGS